MNATTPNFGNIASGSAVTNFELDAASGTVTEAGTGSFLPGSVTSRSTPTVITINCTGGSCSNNVTVSITTSSGTGAAGRINQLEVSFSGQTAQLQSGSTSGGNSLSFVIKPVGNGSSKSFLLGMTVPIAANGSGYSTAPYAITVTGSSLTTGTGSAAVQANVSAPLSITRQSELDFGTLVQVTNQDGQVLFPAAGQGNTWTLTNMAQLKPHTIGYYKITGNANSQIGVSIAPSPLTLSRSGGGSLTMSVSNTAQGTQFLDGTGTKYFYVGGSISSIPFTTTAAGKYSGVYTVTVIYP